MEENKVSGASGGGDGSDGVGGGGGNGCGPALVVMEELSVTVTMGTK